MTQGYRHSRLGQQPVGALQGAGAAMFDASNFKGLGGSTGVYGHERITMNLEDVVLHEHKLNTILENLRNDSNASLACEDWWDLTESSDIYHSICSKLIRDI